MESEPDDWWSQDGPGPARLLRYQLKALNGGAFLQMETTAENDLEHLSDGRQEVHIAMLPNQLRRLGQHLLQCAEFLDPSHKRPQ